MAALNAFHAEREKVLLADDGWFTVAGLHFLNPGDNKFGSDPLNDIVLEYADVPKQAGVITMNGTTVTIKAADGQTLTYNGKPAKEGALHLAENGKPADPITYKSTTFFLHYSGPRLAIRVRDQNAPLRKNFSGLKWYPANPAVKVVGQVHAARDAEDGAGAEHPRRPRAVHRGRQRRGDHRRQDREHGSVEVRQPVVVRVPRSHQRRHHVSVGAIPLHRHAAGPDGKVVMDFNRARNPPCAYNPWTTCPLPPAANKLAGAHRSGREALSR